MGIFTTNPSQRIQRYHPNNVWAFWGESYPAMHTKNLWSDSIHDHGSSFLSWPNPKASHFVKKCRNVTSASIRLRALDEIHLKQKSVNMETKQIAWKDVIRLLKMVAFGNSALPSGEYTQHTQFLVLTPVSFQTCPGLCNPPWTCMSIRRFRLWASQNGRNLYSYTSSVKQSNDCVRFPVIPCVHICIHVHVYIYI